MYPPWHMHPQAKGSPVFPPYAMQGMPYYPNYMGQSPYFQPPYSPHDDSRSHSGRKTRRRRHSMDSRDTNSEVETHETDTFPRRKHDDVTDDEENSTSRKPKNKGGKSRKQHGTVVIRNINFVTPAKQGSSDSDPQSCSASGTDDEKVDDETKKLKKKVGYQKSADPLEASAREKRISGPTGDDGHWQAFKNFLLTDADENNSSPKSGMFAAEGKVQGRKRQSGVRDDSAALGMHKSGEYDVDGNLDIAGDATCVRKTVDDQMVIHGQDPNMKYNSEKDLQFMEAGVRRGAYGKPVDKSMEYVINRHEKLTDVWDPSLDPVIRNGFQDASGTNNKGSSHGISDESFLVLQRSGSSEVTGDGRRTMDMDCELPLVLHNKEDNKVGTRSQANYEPNDLNLMPNRAMENLPSGYDPAIDCEMQAQIKDTAKLSGKKKEVPADAKGGPKKGAKDQKLKPEKRTTVSTRREKSSKFSPAEDARARAEKLRAYKADLQKLKKEKEEEQMKRIEALKLERQKRIAAKSGVKPVQSPSSSQQAKLKPSPASQKSSKFSDTEPGSCSPLQRSKLRIISKVSPDSSKATKSTNRLIRSASSLKSQKEDKVIATPDSKATMSRIRRLSEPKGTVSSVKPATSEAVSRHRVSERSEIKRVPSVAPVDKAKSSAVPEVKVRATKASAMPVISQRKSTKELSQKPNDKNLVSGLVNVNTDVSRGNTNNSLPRDVDDNLVIDKTVVMLEREKPSAPIFHAPKDSVDVHTTQSHANSHVSKQEDDVTVPPPASPITVKEVDQEREASNCVVKRQYDNDVAETERVSPTVPYQAPYARVSSIEDPCMGDSNYEKAPPSVDMAATGVQTTKVHVSDTQRPGLAKISEADSGKYQGKESSKGLKRLLMFGKKSSAATERNIESDKVATNASTTVDNGSNGSSSEVFTVKHLLTHDDSSSNDTTSKKPSRPFSLLSHFRSKTSSEKKLAT
ncbi:COP1-interacting protein 7 [Bienertia sinuspersici]